MVSIVRSLTTPRARSTAVPGLARLSRNMYATPPHSTRKSASASNYTPLLSLSAALLYRCPPSFVYDPASRRCARVTETPACVRHSSADLQLRDPLFVHQLEESQLDAFFRSSANRATFRTGGHENQRPYYEMTGLRRARGAFAP